MIAARVGNRVPSNILFQQRTLLVAPCGIGSEAASNHGIIRIQNISVKTGAAILSRRPCVLRVIAQELKQHFFLIRSGFPFGARWSQMYLELGDKFAAAKSKSIPAGGTAPATSGQNERCYTVICYLRSPSPC